MSVSPTHPRTLAVAAVAALALALPGGAGAATPGNPQVLRLSASGTPTVLAGGSPFTTLGGVAVSSDDTLYLANQGPIGPSPAGAGLYALAGASTAPAPTTFAPLATTAPTYAPIGVVVSGSSVLSMDGDRVIATTRTAPATQTVLSSGQLYDSLGVDPQFGAVSGSTLYTTASGSCASVGGGGAYVIAVDLTTGTQTQVADLGCADLGGIAVEQSGTLLVAETSSNVDVGKPGVPQLVRVTPATGQAVPLSAGNGKALLKAPQGIVSTGPTTLYVADATAGVIQVDPTTGRQRAFSTPGAKSPLGNAFGIAQGPDGTLYVSEAGVPPVLTAASAPSRQRVSSRGLAFTAGCRPTCTLAYDVAVSIPRGPGFAQDGAIAKVAARKGRAVKLPSSVDRRIARALKQGQRVTAVLTLTPRDPNSGGAGVSRKLKVTYVR